MMSLLGLIREARSRHRPNLSSGASSPKEKAEYQRWIAAHDRLGPDQVAAIATAFGKDAPLVTVLVDPRGASHEALERTLGSVRKQLYPNTDIVTKPWGPATLSQARGSFVAPVMAGDSLAVHALPTLVFQLLAHPDAAFGYSDEDWVDSDGARSQPYFKSQWNPDLALAQDYASRLALIRTTAAREVGGFQSGGAEAVLYDLILKLGQTGAAVTHAPFVLYHRARERPAPDDRKMTEVVDRHLSRTGSGARATSAGPATRRIHWPLPPSRPLVSLLVPTRDNVDVLRVCVEGLRHGTDYPNLEILVLDNDSIEPATHDYFRTLRGDPRVRVLQIPGVFNFSRINNAGAAEARGELLGLINNDLKVMKPDWLNELAAQAWRPEVGAAGAMLLYADGSVQHAGCILGIGGVASHIYKGRRQEEPGHGRRMQAAQAMSAVTAACLLTRRSVWDEMGGFDEALAVAYNDVDYCLRVGEAGYRVVWTPHAKLYHLESATRGQDKAGEQRMRLEAEKSKMADRWAGKLLDDPFFSPNLALNSTDCRPAFGPRIAPAWEGLALGR